MGEILRFFRHNTTCRSGYFQVMPTNLCMQNLLTAAVNKPFIEILRTSRQTSYQFCLILWNIRFSGVFEQEKALESFLIKPKGSKYAAR